jgi:thiamine pyrophosphokinase
MPRSVLLFCGGDTPSESTLALIGTCDFVIAADSGIDHALGAGISIDIAVGDFDSVSVTGLAAARASGAQIQEHASQKDQTDFELALASAVQAGATRIEVVAIDGGRLDHQLANLVALADPALANAEVRAHTDRETITVVRRSATLRAKPGSLISLIPVGSDVHGITTSGLTYPLDDETLLATSSRGISNTFATELATVTVSSGVLLAIENRL